MVAVFNSGSAAVWCLSCEIKRDSKISKTGENGNYVVDDEDTMKSLKIGDFVCTFDTGDTYIFGYNKKKQKGLFKQ